MRKWLLKKGIYNISNISSIGDALGKLRPLVVYVDKELSDWLEGKALEGYKKGGLIRHIVAEYARNEVAKNAAA